MDKKSKNLIIIVAGVGVIAIVIAVALALIVSTTNSVSYKLEVGQKYLEKGNYDDAIVVFKQAIEIDETNVDAYAGLVLAYYEKGMLNEARSVLSNALKITGNNNKLIILERDLFRNIIVSKNFADDDSANGNNDSPDSDKKQQQESDANVSEVVLAGKVIDNIKKTGISDATVKIFKGNNVNGELLAELKTDSSGAYSTVVAGEEKYYIFVEKNNYTSKGEEIYVFATKSKTTKDIEIAEAGAKIVSGKVIDAATGQGISGARVKVYVAESYVGDAITNSTGEYSINVEGAESYKLVVSADGYIENQISFDWDNSSMEMNIDIPLSSVLADEQIRIVLTWGENPKDLDSYLSGTSSTGKTVNINYTSQVSMDAAGNTIAELDLDDIDGFGPETTTIYDIYGSYEFIVRDYNRTGTMSSTEAQVKVYKGSMLLNTINVPSDVVDNWDVLRIENGEVYITNCALR